MKKKDKTRQLAAIALIECVSVCMNMQNIWYKFYMFHTIVLSYECRGNQKQGERAPRPRPTAVPMEHRSWAAQRRDNHASTQKTAEEAHRQSPHGHRGSGRGRGPTRSSITQIHGRGFLVFCRVFKLIRSGLFFQRNLEKQ